MNVSFPDLCIITRLKKLALSLLVQGLPGEAAEPGPPGETGLMVRSGSVQQSHRYKSVKPFGSMKSEVSAQENKIHQM